MAQAAGRCRIGRRRAIFPLLVALCWRSFTTMLTSAIPAAVQPLLSGSHVRRNGRRRWIPCSHRNLPPWLTAAELSQWGFRRGATRHCPLAVRARPHWPWMITVAPIRNSAMCSASACQINPLPNARLDNGRKRSDYREMRARAVVAMAPPGAALFTRRQGIESIKIPVLLLQGDQDMLLKYPNDARFFKSPTRAEHHIVPADHFVLMSTNKPAPPKPTPPVPKTRRRHPPWPPPAPETLPPRAAKSVADSGPALARRFAWTVFHHRHGGPAADANRSVSDNRARIADKFAVPWNPADRRRARCGSRPARHRQPPPPIDKPRNHRRA